jgi:hypothetical protein
METSSRARRRKYAGKKNKGTGELTAIAFALHRIKKFTAWKDEIEDIKRGNE